MDEQTKGLQNSLLDVSDPPAVEVLNPDGLSPFVFTCEHAGRLVPSSLDRLGLEDQHFDAHIAWDPGVEQIGRMLAKLMDAPVVLQTYSRLVIDCNRPLGTEQSIPLVSDGVVIPGNIRLENWDREARAKAIHMPFHSAVAEILDRRLVKGRFTAIAAVHSFTPRLSMDPTPRPWDLGLLYNHDGRLSLLLEEAVREIANHLNISLNQPYFVSDETDYTLPVHGEARKIPNVLLEIRNDHLKDTEGQIMWARKLATAFEMITGQLQ